MPAVARLSTVARLIHGIHNVALDLPHRFMTNKVSGNKFSGDFSRLASFTVFLNLAVIKAE